MTRTSRPHRTLHLTAALGVSAALTLSACGSPDEGSLRFAWWGSTERNQLTQEALEAFEAETGLSVSGESSDTAGHFDRLATAVAGGDAPDVFTLGGAYPGEYADRGALLDLDTVSDRLDLGTLDESALENGQIDGTQYALSTGSNALAVIVNPALLEEAGAERPDPQTWTWEDFEEIAEQVAENTDAYGADGFDHDTVEVFARQHGEPLYTEEGQVGVTQDALEDMLTRMQDMVDTGAAPPASVITEQEGAAPEETLLATGQVAMTIDWSNFLSTFSQSVGEELELWPLPGEAETPGVWQQSSQFYAISADTEDSEAAAELIDFLVNSPAAVEIMGLERGVPDNPEMREILSGSLDEDQQAEVDYIEEVAERETAQRWIGPAGSTAIEDITPRIIDLLLHQGVTPSDAAEQWLDEARAAVGE
ncbi:ABC transporter substrate-binding protein [Nesterenkonia xinjiangensis]|uniref:Multiple sugar transport system substrate-binding protein n=1 Tax=Nesterenkonia xinjiangensis TaxID=225327 RepID=A0A7Z0GKR6_9MICC|nr:sugar ABC transporter substrate-binding protein [Nesterenkonia xinjiangensis]NYJ77819.1 multiple sugar transport system substrate-binding protein [Nesterenkonia xinjiangensis]